MKKVPIRKAPRGARVDPSFHVGSNASVPDLVSALCSKVTDDAWFTIEGAFIAYQRGECFRGQAIDAIRSACDNETMRLGALQNIQSALTGK